MSEYEDPHYAYVPPPAPPGRRLGRGVKAALIGGTVLAVLLAVNLGIDDGRDRYEDSIKNPSADGRSRIIPGEATREQPWLGSPAATWAEGEAGIVLPEARPVGAFTADQVAGHLRTVRTFLAATNLDPATVKGGTPRQALELLTKESRADLEAQLAHPTDQDDPSLVFSRFDPQRAVPVTDTVKVKGELSFAEGSEGELLVKSDFSFVYALWPGPEAGRPRTSAAPSAVVPAAFGNPVFQARVEREVVRRQQEFHFLDPEKYEVRPGQMAVGKLAASFANNVCTMGSGFLETEFGGSDDVDASGKPVDPYDRGSGDAAGDGGCYAIRRT